MQKQSINQIPTAKEDETNDVVLGEMNKLLLKSYKN
jgi:hypothetical protein